MTRDLEILYRDDRCLAVMKPAGLLVHRSDRAPGAPSALRRVRRQVGRWVYPVHRLDRPTSGVLLFALDAGAARELCLAFRRGEVDKVYWAVVRGYAAEAGLVEHPLAGAPGGRPRDALTAYRRLATAEVPVPVGRYATGRYSLVEARPRTGRRHQIRRHFAHLSHPVVGDTTHGDGRHNRLFRERFGVRRLLLTAAALTFRPPGAEGEILVRAAPEPDLVALFRELGWPPPGPAGP